MRYHSEPLAPEGLKSFGQIDIYEGKAGQLLIEAAFECSAGAKFPIVAVVTLGSVASSPSFYGALSVIHAQLRPFSR
jgi:hypothetical protein